MINDKCVKCCEFVEDFNADEVIYIEGHTRCLIESETELPREALQDVTIDFDVDGSGAFVSDTKLLSEMLKDLSIDFIAVDKILVVSAYDCIIDAA